MTELVTDSRRVQILQKEMDRKIGDKALDIQQAITQIQERGTMLNDYIAPVDSLQFRKDEGKIILGGFNERYHDISDAAMTQVCQKFELPTNWVKPNLRSGEEWKLQLMWEILQRYANHIDRDRVLIRSVNNKVHGFLSDKYRRLDTAKLFLAFLLAANDQDSRLVNSSVSETRDFIEVLKPEIYQIQTKNNDIVPFTVGAQLRNSDFGHSKLELSVYITNVVCMNGMTGKRLLSQTHLGRKLPDNINMSQEYYEKDSEAMELGVRDIMKNVYAQEYVEQTTAQIMKASEIEYADVAKEVLHLESFGVQKGEMDEITKRLLNPKVEDGIAGKTNSCWSLTQAITAVARDKGGDRQRDLEDVAGNMLAKLA